ncbi:MAG TPA: ComF family protein [Firmicutes bacterium]|nr:ComF family protein [Bacillota bacterium]
MRTADTESTLCIDCTAHRPFDMARAAGCYEYPLKEVIYRFKFAGDVSLSAPLGMLMSWRLLELIAASCSYPDVIVPVPLHPSRLKHRGFNQAECLALAVSREWGGIPVLKVLRRHRPTQAQKQLGRDERLCNLAGAFSVVKPRLFWGRNVLLVDDVITTGTTVEACAEVLKKAGAARVDVLAAAAVPAISAVVLRSALS